jgi:alpha-glucuronidase
MNPLCAWPRVVAVWISTVAIGSVAWAEDGYRLWLRYEPVEDKVLREDYRRRATELVGDFDSAMGRIIACELHQGVLGLLQAELPLSSRVSRDGAITIVGPKDMLAVKALGLGDELRNLGEDGFLIRSMMVGGHNAIVIASGGEHGLLYGAFQFLRLLQTRQSLDSLNMREAPRLALRLLNHWDNLDGSVERGYAGKSIWNWAKLPDVRDARYVDYARANASLGINGVVLNNVNAKAEQLEPENLKKAAAVAGALRPYGIRVYLSVNFAAPKRLGLVGTADPGRSEVRTWWKGKAREIYGLIPDFGGFLVKANSEGQPGPQDYGLSHADGANMLADALRPHGGVVIWRAFVYNSTRIDSDRAKRAYLEFKPLDGKFRDNVLVQVKNGPIDFQPREPFHPLFGAMQHTSLMPELEITQENMGHSTDLVYLGSLWEEFLDSDTFADGPGSTVGKILSRQPRTGISGVANVGRSRNWCGHDFAQANWYAYGRLAWSGSLNAEAVAAEWARMTWGNDPRLVREVVRMMCCSWEACVNYEMPLGLHHLMDGGDHYDPRPEVVNPSAPDYSAAYYHKADFDGVGFDRTATGSDALSQYYPQVRERWRQPETCPPELLLWFHHVDWDYRLRTGRTVWEELCFRYQQGVRDVLRMQRSWAALRSKVDAERFAAVSHRLDLQLEHAVKWRDVCLGYFHSVNCRTIPGSLDK